MYDVMHNYFKGRSDNRGFGDLGTSHSIYQKGCLGFLPAWTRELIKLCEKNKPLSWIERTFKTKPLKGQELERFVKSLQQRLQLSDEYSNLSFCFREMENLLCKVYRILNCGSKDKLWCDTLPPFALLFRFPAGDNVTVIHLDGSEEILDGSAAINTFPCDNQRLTMGEIVEELHLPKTLPTIERIHEYRLGEFFWRPVAQFELEYSINALEINADIKEKSNAMLQNILRPAPDLRTQYNGPTKKVCR